LQHGQQREGQVCLREDVDLHVAVEAVARLVVYADAEPGVADKRVEPRELGCQLPRHLVGLLEVFEVALSPFDFAAVAVFLECFLCFVGVLFFVREEVDLCGVVLEDVGDDAVADASGAAGHDVDLFLISREQL
jgi:hypothetical protein